MIYDNRRQYGTMNEKSNSQYFVKKDTLTVEPNQV